MDKLSKKMRSGYKALVPYFTVGYPNIEESRKVFRAFAEAGADCIEIGIPFSDPLADGPTIQASSYKAIQAGGGLKAGLEMIKSLRAEGVEAPCVVFSYYNPIYRMGIMEFAKKAADAEADAALVPDLPVEESGLLSEALSAFGMGLVMLAAPTSPPLRMKAIQKHSNGFVYAVSVTGVTGARTELPEYLGDFVRKLKAAGELPVAVGFGVGTPEQAKEVAKSADGVVVGSAFIRAYDEGGIENVSRLARSLRESLDGAR